MSNFEIVYYLNQDNSIELYMKNNGEFVINRLVAKMAKLVIDDYELDDNNKDKLKQAIKINSYIRLLNKGYTFEEINNLLSNEFHKQYRLGKRVATLFAIEEEQEALNLAYKVCVDDKDVEQLKPFLYCTNKVMSICNEKTNKSMCLKRDFNKTSVC